jgi:threonine aldolase
MAQKLYNKVKGISGIKITKPVQSNVVFATIPREWNTELINHTPFYIATIPREWNTELINHTPFYIWREEINEVRWMCSFDTTEKDIEDFANLIKRLAIKA